MSKVDARLRRRRRRKSRQWQGLWVLQKLPLAPLCRRGPLCPPVDSYSTSERLRAGHEIPMLRTVPLPACLWCALAEAVRVGQVLEAATRENMRIREVRSFIH